MIDFTNIARMRYARRARQLREMSASTAATEAVQRRVLDFLLSQGRLTRYGAEHGFDAISGYDDFRRRVPIVQYEDIRPLAMRMVEGERDVLWPGRSMRFAQSSGTSGGKSKYIPITPRALKMNHFAGAADAMISYLDHNPHSRIFSGKAFILGGSYANALSLPVGVKVGDLSATLIDCINPVVNLFRIPDKKTALLESWEEKLPRLIEAAAGANVTNLSGVPSWFLTVLKGVLERTGAQTIHDVWPNLEVFFHGGIAFGPYREQYREITDPERMHYVETYNASEGFFAIQDRPESGAMLLLTDRDVFYEFLPLSELDKPEPQALAAWEVEAGRTYALVITSSNGLWRYLIGDTVRIESTAPLRITIAGRTQSFINAFGEELMVYNADRAIERACRELGCAVANYTAGPQFSSKGQKAHHRWVIEWSRPPESVEAFAASLDGHLQAENSDYQAKRTGGIFLGEPEIISVRAGTFDRWLARTGKLGGQRKIPRLSNTPDLVDQMLALKNSSENSENSENSEIPQTPN